MPWSLVPNSCTSPWRPTTYWPIIWCRCFACSAMLPSSSIALKSNISITCRFIINMRMMGGRLFQVRIHNVQQPSELIEIIKTVENIWFTVKDVQFIQAYSRAYLLVRHNKWFALHIIESKASTQAHKPWMVDFFVTWRNFKYPTWNIYLRTTLTSRVPITSVQSANCLCILSSERHLLECINHEWPFLCNPLKFQNIQLGKLIQGPF